MELLKYARTSLGTLSVMKIGELRIELLPVDNSDSITHVSNFIKFLKPRLFLFLCIR